MSAAPAVSLVVVPAVVPRLVDAVGDRVDDQQPADDRGKDERFFAYVDVRDNTQSNWRSYSDRPVPTEDVEDEIDLNDIVETHGGSNVRIMDYQIKYTDDFYNSMISGLGAGSRSAQTILSQQEGVMLQLNSQRESISGVSLDEEMVNLIKFQQAYAASARMITVPSS